MYRIAIRNWGCQCVVERYSLGRCPPKGTVARPASPRSSGALDDLQFDTDLLQPLYQMPLGAVPVAFTEVIRSKVFMQECRATACARWRPVYRVLHYDDAPFGATPLPCEGSTGRGDSSHEAERRPRRPVTGPPAAMRSPGQPSQTFVCLRLTASHRKEILSAFVHSCRCPSTG